MAVCGPRSYELDEGGFWIPAIDDFRKKRPVEGWPAFRAITKDRRICDFDKSAIAIEQGHRSMGAGVYADYVRHCEACSKNALAIRVLMRIDVVP